MLDVFRVQGSDLLAVIAEVAAERRRAVLGVEPCLRAGTVAAADVVDELVEAMIDEDGSIEHVRAGTELHRYLTGAMLRFPLPPTPDVTGRPPRWSRSEEHVRVGRLDHALQVQAVARVERRRAAPADRVDELRVHGAVGVRQRDLGAVQEGLAAGSEDLDVGAEGTDLRRRGHGRLAVPAPPGGRA